MQGVNRRRRWLAKALAVAAAVAASPAFAGLPNLTNALNWLQTLFAGIAVAVVTVAGTWVGFETLHRGAQWEDVKRIVIGATIIGAMSTIAAVLV
jgi:peptidoglycan/LPS O-acetylase OafA/YrhL